MECSGKIQVAFVGDTHVIKLSGDVRLNLCTGLEKYINEIIATPNFSNVVIDLSQAQAIDSTTLGQLAKISILCREHFQLTPTIASPNAAITRLLLSMGFDQVFHIINQSFTDEIQFEEWLTESMDEEEGRLKVIEAHRVLMSLNDKNKSEFHDLVYSLESEGHHR